MARVEVATQSWGYVVDSKGRPRADALCQISATVYQASVGVGTISAANFRSNAEGLLPGWVEQNTYTLTEPDGTVRQVEAARGDAAAVGDVPAHAADTTDVHGIADTALLVRKENLPYKDLYDYAYDPVATDNEVHVNAAIAALPAGSEGKQGAIMFPGPDIKCSGEITGLAHSQGVRFIGRAGPTSWPAAGAQSQLRFLQANSITGRAVDVRSSAGFTCEHMTVTNENDGFLGNLFDFEWFNVAADSDANGMVFRDVFLGGRGEKGSGLGGYARSCLRLKRAIIGTFDRVIFQWAENGVTGQEEEAGGIRYSNAHTFLACTWARLCNGILNPGLDWEVLSPLIEGFANGDGVAASSFFRSFVKLDYTATFAPGSTFGGIKVRGGGVEDSFTCDYWFDDGAHGCWRGLEVEGFNMGAGKVLKAVNAGNSKQVSFRNCEMGAAAVSVGATDHVVDCGPDGIDGLIVENCNLEAGGATPIKRHDRRASLKNNRWASGAVNQDVASLEAIIRTFNRGATGAVQGAGVQAGALYDGSSDLAGHFWFWTHATVPVVGAQFRVTFGESFKEVRPATKPIVVITPTTALAAGIMNKVFVPQTSLDYFELHANPVLAANTTYEFQYQVIG